MLSINIFSVGANGVVRWTNRLLVAWEPTYKSRPLGTVWGLSLERGKTRGRKLLIIWVNMMIDYLALKR